MSTIAAQFRSAVEAAALAAGIKVGPNQVRETFSLVNLARGTATNCFRLRLPSAKSLPDAAKVLRNFRATFTGQHETGKALSIECVLSGAIYGKKLVDWDGNLVDRLG